MRIIYTLFIRTYSIVIRLVSLFNRKAEKWVNGRKDIFTRMEEKIRNQDLIGESLIWFHCASLGEFEQGRPLMERLKEGNAPVKIVLTFFSPSGFEVRKNYPGADFIFYLPEDTPSNAERFIRLFSIKAAFFIKYEFWFNTLYVLKKLGIPAYLVSGIFRQEQYFFAIYGGWARRHLGYFSHLFLQDENSRLLLERFGVVNATVTGDTRFDRVLEIARQKKEFPLIRKFAGNELILVAGSTWKEDEKIIAGLAAIRNKKLKILIAPHEINDEHIRAVAGLFENENVVCYSKAEDKNAGGSNVMIVDNVGMLSSLYQYGHLAYIGGGFGEGIHNILEAAAFGLPSIFGPNYLRFNEAVDLVKSGGAFCIRDETEMDALLDDFISRPEKIRETGVVSLNYVSENRGAVDRIMNILNQQTLYPQLLHLIHPSSKIKPPGSLQEGQA